MITLPGRRGLSWQAMMQRPALAFTAWVVLLLALGAAVAIREVRSHDGCRSHGGQVVVTGWVTTTCQTPTVTVTTP